MAEKKEEQQRSHEMSETSTVFSRALLTGFIGGVLASLFGIFLYYFNFIEVSPKAYIVRSWTHAGWTNTWLGNLVTVVVIGLISIGVAIIYYGILKKINSLWMGVAYGIILWAVVFFVLNPIFTKVPSVGELEAKSIVTTICLYIFYGMFVGYSISFDYYDTNMSKASKKKDKKESN